MNTLRDASYLDYDAVFLLVGVAEPVAGGLERALGELLGHPAGEPLRRAWPGGRRLTAQTAAARARTAVGTADAALTDAQLIAEVHAAGYRGLPISVTVAGDRVAVSFAHAIADGGGMILLLHALLACATGEEPSAPEGRPARWPLLRALVAAGPREVLAVWRSHPDATVPPVLPPSPTPQQASLQQARLLRIRLDAARLDRIRRAKHGEGKGRATLSTRVASLALAAVRATSRTDADVRVTVPIDLRHLARGRVDGNFVTTAPLGGLRSTTWTPSRISERVAALSGTAGLVTLALGTVYGLRARLRRAAPWRETAVSVSLLTSVPLPAAVWADSGATGIACATIGPWPSSLFVFVWFAGDEAFLSVWDEADAVDLSRFEDALEEELVRREPGRG